MLEYGGNELVIQFLRVLCNRHALCIAVINFDMAGAKTHGIRGNRIPEILPQPFIGGKIKLEMTFLTDPEEVVQNLQTCIVVECRNGAAQCGQRANEMALYLTEPVPRLLDACFIGGENHVLVLIHITDFAGTGFDLPVFLCAVFVQPIISTPVQDVPHKCLFVHPLADDTDLGPAIGRDSRVYNAKLCSDFLFVRIAAHGIVDVRNTPHLTVHAAGSPDTIHIDAVNGNLFLNGTGQRIAAPCFFGRCVFIQAHGVSPFFSGAFSCLGFREWEYRLSDSQIRQLPPRTVLSNMASKKDSKVRSS